MSVCPNCGNQLPDGAMFCNICGTKIEAAAPQPAQPVPPVQPAAPVVDPYDHTADFEQDDISKNKVFAMGAYLLDWIGVIIAMLAAPKSEYAEFHAKQAMKIAVCETLCGLAAAVLCWTFIVPAAAVVALGILFVLRIIAFISVCCGKAKEPAIIKKFGFFK